MQEWLVEACLELVSYNEQTILILLEGLSSLCIRKTVENELKLRFKKLGKIETMKKFFPPTP
jgi:hypothetical protein